MSLRLLTRICLLPLLCAFGGIPLATAQELSASRQRLRMDADWRFALDPHVGPSPAAAGTPVVHWRWHPTDRAGAASADLAAPDLDDAGPDWQPIDVPKPDVFHGKPGYAWFRATLPNPPPGAPSDAVPTLHFGCVDDNATVYLNGQKILHHEGWAEPIEASLVSGWKPGGPNTVAVLVENTDGGGGITQPVTLYNAMPPDLHPAPSRADFDDHAWQTVHLPHDYVVAGKFDPHADGQHGFLPTPEAWYRRTFTMPADWRGRSVWIDFDGAFSDARVWFNGQFLGEHRSGYTGARYDLGQLARYGEPNTLVVHVDPSKLEGWWYEGGGIYRHVWLNAADPVHLAPDTTFVSTEVDDIAPDGQTAGSVDVNIRTTLAFPGDAPAPATVEARLIGPDGQTVGDAALLADAVRPDTARGEQPLACHERLAHVRLWSVDRPTLYRLRLVVRGADGKTLDTQETAFGIRKIRFDADRGFFLNEQPVKLQGTCNHQDFAGIGIALPDNVLEWRIRRLKECGSNAYRTSHNPVASELLDACDRLGMLVMDETRHFGDTYATKTSEGTPTDDLGDLAWQVRHDRNHPSVILWSIANEEWQVEGKPDSGRIARAMKARVDALDPTRPLVAALTYKGYFAEEGISGVTDVQGFNYAGGKEFDRYHGSRPGHPQVGSETASAVTTRGVYALQPLPHSGQMGEPEKGYVNAYGAVASGHPVAESAWRPIAERPFNAGAFVWTGFDYRGEPSPFQWPCVNSHFGFMDMCGFPKDDYYYYKAWWDPQHPSVHLLPHWNWPTDRGEVLVYCHGNTERVELLLNGNSLGTKDMPRNGHLEWRVLYAPGRLEARGFNGAQVAATDAVETTGPAAELQLDPANGTEFKADAEDVAIVWVDVRDAQGRTVPTADDEIAFTVEGPGTIAGVGNGDPSSHEPDKATNRRAFNGRCAVMLQTTDQPGQITLTAHAPGLPPRTLTLRSALGGDGRGL